MEQLFYDALSAHSMMLIVFAFAGGVVSSLLPCTVGMLPVLVGYVGGYTEQSRWETLREILLFMLGFALVLTALGIIATLLGTQLGALVGPTWYYVLGAVAILMGLQLLEVLHIQWPQFVPRMPEKQQHIFAPLLLGIAFGAASSPCGTPFLTGILGMISNEHNWMLGGFSLFAYAVGQSVLLLVMGLFTGQLKRMAILRHVGSVMTKLSGAVFILAGILLIAQGAGWLDPLAFIPAQPE